MNFRHTSLPVIKLIDLTKKVEGLLVSIIS
jgi:hypothetical protein